VRSQDDRAQMFAALGDRLRLDIVDELALSDRTPGELIQKFEITSALLAHHLDVLENAQIVERIESSADRRKRFVRLAERNLPLLVSSKYPGNIQFICRHNSARSQLAAAIWKKFVGTAASSAGTEPAKTVHPLTIQIAKRHNLDLGQAIPRKYRPTSAHGRLEITVCDQSHDDLSMPLSRSHWSLPDPTNVGTMAAFEQTYQELFKRIIPLAK
jgi:ArsR family transcriptional regulator, arsenate/arsenite/antimonite-responsive transcriptional repressor / arsenate reductase (thioredoxin)